MKFLTFFAVLFILTHSFTCFCQDNLQESSNYKKLIFKNDSVDVYLFIDKEICLNKITLFFSTSLELGSIDYFVFYLIDDFNIFFENEIKGEDFVKGKIYYSSGFMLNKDVFNMICAKKINKIKFITSDCKSLWFQLNKSIIQIFDD